MKKIFIALAITVASLANAKTVNYDVYQTAKTVESSSSLNLNYFDFKIQNAVASKTTIVRPCGHSGPVRDREQPGLCSTAEVKTVKVATVLFSYRPFGVADRDGEVTNGKQTFFVSFNIELSQLSDEDIATLKSGDRNARKALAKELVDVMVSRYRNNHTITISTK